MSFAMTGRPQITAAAAQMGKVQRKTRKPAHSAYLHFVPWVLTPFFAAPVLPGETLKNVLVQGRLITTPVASQVTGCWLETYWFYVKHRHLASADGYVSMMIDPSFDVSTITGSADSRFMMANGDMQFAFEAYEAVVNEFFRGDGEDASTGKVSGSSLNYARLRMPGWWDSIVPSSQLVTEPTIGADTIGGADLNQVGELARALDRYNNAVMLGLTDMEYDDWLAMYGVRITAPQDDRPELIRYTREWSYPTNTVNVDTAQRVASVFSWSLTERIDKDRYFKEPGVLLGIVLVRPKLYHDYASAGIGLLNDFQSWQSPFAMGPTDAYRELPGGMAGYHWDTRDLFLHGDQWWDVQRGTGPTRMAFPTDGVFDYPPSTLINAWFNDGGDGSTGHIKADMAINLTVLGRLGPDVSPRTVG